MQACECCRNRKRKRFYYWILCGEIPWISNPYHSVYIYIHSSSNPTSYFIHWKYVHDGEDQKRKEMFHHYSFSNY